MYKALHTKTNEEIIILSPAWRKKLDQLREMDHEDLLVCQGCRQPLRVKAGEHKRPHFAHKHLEACSYGTESVELLNARAVLYAWLEQQFAEAVSVEKELPGAALPRPVDCWVEAENGPYAYWIIEAGIKLAPREAIKAAFAAGAVKMHWVFLVKMLNEEKKEYQSVLLTPTERAFMQTTPFDEMESGAGEPGFTLHYLDVEEEGLTTYRGLTLFHRPNWYKGIKKCARLEDILASRVDGGPVHPGELTRLSTIRGRRNRLEQKRQKFQARALDWETHQPAAAVESSLPKTPLYHERPLEATGAPEALPCATCGQVTTEYWSTFFDSSGRKLCRCRDCLTWSDSAQTP